MVLDKKGIILRIICFTGSRAEYYLLRPLLIAINKIAKYQLFLIISGGILFEENQKTILDIKKDGINICGKIKISNLNSNHSLSIGEICIDTVNVIKKINPNLSIVYGDRYESFGFAIAASHSNIPLIHLEAGDITEGGTYDDQIRHCISKLSQLFCTSTKKGCETLYRIGEEKWRCFQSGLLSCEDMRTITDMDRKEIIRKLKILDQEPILLATMHSIPRDLNLTEKEATEFFEGLKIYSNKKPSKIIITSPNNDKGSDIVKSLLKRNLKSIKNAEYIESIGGANYHSIMSLAKERIVIVCGNSSSVIKEAPFYGAHSLNIGVRQDGRESADSQINCMCERNIISTNLKELSERKCKIGFNPYIKNNPSGNIISFIEKIFNEKTLSEIMFKKWER